MDTNRRTDAADSFTRRPTRWFATAIVMILVAAGLPAFGPGVSGDVAAGAAPATPAVAPIIPAGHGQPDLISDNVGGAAVRLRTHDGAEVPGDVFVLMAAAGSPAQARVYDQTPFVLGRPEIHPEPAESNHVAVALMAELVGTPVTHTDLTSPPAGGHSFGLGYLVGYLNIISDGAFTSDVRVAVTGQIQENGYVGSVSGLEEKTAAAQLASVDVLFVPGKPGADTLDRYAGRYEGELFRARNTGAALADERRWDRYEAWGASHTAGEMDIIGVRHLGDIAAYLCGAGSSEACSVRDSLSAVIFDSSPAEPMTSESTTAPASSTPWK